MRNRTRKRNKNRKKNSRLVPSIPRALMHEKRTTVKPWYAEAAAVDVDKLRNELSVAQLRSRPLTPDERFAAKSLLDQKRRVIVKLENRIEEGERRRAL